MADVGDRVKLKVDVISAGLEYPANSEGTIIRIATEPWRRFPINVKFDGYDDPAPCAPYVHGMAQQRAYRKSNEEALP